MNPNTFPRITTSDVPWLTVEQMAEADRMAIGEFGIELLQMMEHAGSGLAAVTDLLQPRGPVVVLAGGGNNGGGGLCAARHLTNRGRDVQVVLASSRLGPAAEHHLRTLAEMGVSSLPSPGEAAIVVDALVGYGLAGPLRGRAAELAAWANDRHVVSLDFPSGHGFDGAVNPDATVTLALPKQGLRAVRPLFLADLGLPARLWKRLGLEVGPLFSSGPILQIE